MNQQTYFELPNNNNTQRFVAEKDLDISSTFPGGNASQSDYWDSYLGSFLYSSPFAQDSFQHQFGARQRCLEKSEKTAPLIQSLDMQQFQDQAVKQNEFQIQFDDFRNELSSSNRRKVEIFETKDEQGSSHGNDENDEFLENEKKGRMPADTRSKKLKNFLSCVQGCILTLEKQNLLQIENEAVINFINSERKCTKKMFESLFQDQEARRVLARVFNNKELHRQLQLTVMSVESRKLYLSQLNLLKKALIVGRLPNL